MQAVDKGGVEPPWAVYNDYTYVKFVFAVAEDGTVIGKGRARIINGNPKQIGPADCWDLLARVPNEADVAISGRRDGGVFKFELENPASVHMTLTQGGSCRQPNGTQTAQLPFFSPLVLAPGFMHPQVPAIDGHFQNFSGNIGSLTFYGNLGVRCARGCSPQRKSHRCSDASVGFVFLTPQTGQLRLFAAASTESPVVAYPPVGIRLAYREVADQGGEVWYHIQNAGFDGWVPSWDTSCTRPPPQVGPAGPRWINTGAPIVNSTGSASTAGRG
jgi:hypothetical protein